MCSDCFLGSGSVPVTVLHWQTGSLPTRGHHRSKTVLRRHPSKREPQSQYGQGQGGHQVLHPIQVSHSDRTKLMEKFKSDFNFFFFYHFESLIRTSRGLAVIDWEEWRPLWDRNWGSKRIYQTLSVKHILQTNRSITVQQATTEAKKQFQVKTQFMILNVCTKICDGM